MQGQAGGKEELAVAVSFKNFKEVVYWQKIKELSESS